MFFNFAICSGLLLAPVVVAIPSGLGARSSRTREPNNHLGHVTRSPPNIQYSNIWAGAVLEESEGSVTSVIGTITVPTPSGSAGDSASVWVGIDGGTCQSAMLQTGIDVTVSSNGPQYLAWYQFHPQAGINFSGITISAKDVIKLNVTTSSPYYGTATVENMTTGQVASKTLNNTAPLCMQNAEWIVEDYLLDSGQPVPFANFGTITFSDAKAIGTSTYTPSSANISEIKQNNQVVTSTSISGSTVTVQYV